MNVALPSDWYKMINNTMMPTWAYLCYLDYDMNDKSKLIVQEINMFIQQVLKSKEANCYELTKLYERSISSNNKINKLSQSQGLKLYYAFAQFRLNRKICKLTIESETKGNANYQGKTSRIIIVRQKNGDDFGNGA